MYEILDPSLNDPRTGPDPRRIQLPLDIMSAILSHIQSPSDLSRVARTSRINHFLAAPLLYHTVSLRRPSRRPRPGGKRMALGALMKPGIAACVKVLEVIGEKEAGEEEGEWWGMGQWSDEETVWAVAMAGVVAGMGRLDVFLWSADAYIHPLLYATLVRHPVLKELRVSYPLLPTSSQDDLNTSTSGLALSGTHASSSALERLRPPITSIPAFKTLRRLNLHNLPGISSFADDFISTIFFSPNLEALSISWRTPTPVGRMLFLRKLLKHPRNPGNMPPGKPDRKLRLKELSLRNVTFDFPIVGDIEEWIDMGRLEKLSLLDCEVIDVSSWLELIGAGTVGSDSSGSFTVSHESPLSSAAGSTPGTIYSSSGASSTSIARTVKLKLKSLRINSTASHWLSLINSFDGLEELHILDPPVEEPTEAANGTKFLDAITTHHGATLKSLRLCSRWNLERRDVSRLFRSCAGLEELAFSMDPSQWKILDVLLIFLTHLRYVHLLDCLPLTSETLRADLVGKRDTIQSMLAQEDMRGMEVFALGSVVCRAERSESWDKRGGRWCRKIRFMEIDEVREWAGIWRAEKID